MRYRPPLVDGEKSFGLRPFEKPMRRINDMERKMPWQLPPPDARPSTDHWALGSGVTSGDTRSLPAGSLPGSSDRLFGRRHRRLGIARSPKKTAQRKVHCPLTNLRFSMRKKNWARGEGEDDKNDEET